MFLLGLLLLGASGAFVGLLIADNLGGGPDYTVTVLGNEIATMNSLAVFLAGIALTLIFCLGLLLVTGGGVLHRRRTRERNAYRAERTGTPVRPAAPATEAPVADRARPADTAPVTVPDTADTPPTADTAAATDDGPVERPRHRRPFFGH